MQARIIPFPGMREAVEPEELNPHSAAYNNLKELFSLSESVESCLFYLATVETLYQDGKITEWELNDLRRIGQEKRADLLKPKKKTIKADGPGCYGYYPEMNQEPPETAEIHARRMYYAGHVALYTALDLKGRGIRRDEHPVTGWPDGTKAYTVTDRAFEKLKGKYVIAMEFLLD